MFNIYTTLHKQSSVMYFVQWFPLDCQNRHFNHYLWYIIMQLLIESLLDSVKPFQTDCFLQSSHFVQKFLPIVGKMFKTT